MLTRLQRRLRRSRKAAARILAKLRRQVRHRQRRLVRARRHAVKHWERRGPAQLRGRRRLRAAGALEPLRRFRSAQPTEAIPPDYDDLAYLYDLVRERRPEVLLELGSGCSTPVLAEAVRANGAGHVWSVDADEGWAAATAAALPPELRTLVTVEHAPAVAEDRDVPGWSHRGLPDVEPDFLYLDSPPLTSERAVAFDPVDLEPRFRPGFVMVIDARHRNARYLRERLRRRYRISRMTARYLFELVD